jgi:hypothetical protein
VGNAAKGVQCHFPEADILIVKDGLTDLTFQKARACTATISDLCFGLGIGEGGRRLLQKLIIPSLPHKKQDRG